VSTVAGGLNNNAAGYQATVAGGSENTAYDNATVAGGEGNQATGAGSFVGGGGDDDYNHQGNIANGPVSTVAGGLGNAASGYASTVGGGNQNTAGSLDATVAGGYGNHATGQGSSVGGGGWDGSNLGGNTASGDASTVGGGLNNQATNTYATVAGGYNNKAGGVASFAAGYGNTVGGNYSCGLGAGGIVSDANAFLWCDGTRAGTSQGAHSFAALATGGVWFYTGPGVQGLHIAPSGSSWITPSDRNAKKNFQAVDTVAVLDKLAAIPIQRWNYKWERDDDVPNIGPMAQDFKAAFYPGRDDKGISTLEFDGVELAAIQGLNQKMEEQLKKQRTELQAKQSEIDGLTRRLATLEATVQKVSEQLEQSKAAPIPAANVRNHGGL
jgi:hypothetical protein